MEKKGKNKSHIPPRFSTLQKKQRQKEQRQAPKTKAEKAKANLVGAVSVRLAAETRSIETQLITLLIAWPAFKVHTFFTSLHFTLLTSHFTLTRERMSWTQSGNVIASGGKTGTSLGKLASLHCISIGATTTHIHPPTHPQIKTLGTIYQLPT